MRLSLCKIEKILLASLLIQFIFFPKVGMYIKAICLLIALSLVMYKSYGKIIIDNYSIIIASYTLWNIISIVHGIVSGFEDEAIKRMSVDVLWPLCYLILAQMPLDDKAIRYLKKILVILAFFLAALDSLMIILDGMGYKGIIDILNQINLNPIVVENSFGTHFNIRIDHQYMYAFLAPFVMICAFEERKNFYRITAALVLVISILLGLGGIWLAVAAAFFMYLFQCLKNNHYRVNVNKIVKYLLILLLLLALLDLFVDFKTEMVQVLSEIDERLLGEVLDESDKTRILQATAMLNLWGGSIAGNGTGVPVYYLRPQGYNFYSDNELSYFVMLYQKGVIGVILFIMVVISAYQLLRKYVNDSTISKAFTISMFSFLIANAFNPYLANISTSWILFIPFLIKRL